MFWKATITIAKSIEAIKISATWTMRSLNCVYRWFYIRVLRYYHVVWSFFFCFYWNHRCVMREKKSIMQNQLCCAGDLALSKFLTSLFWYQYIGQIVNNVSIDSNLGFVINFINSNHVVKYLNWLYCDDTQ